MDITSYKCPCCGAPLVFDAPTQKLKCDSCNNIYDREEFETAFSDEQQASGEDRYDWEDYTGSHVNGTVTYTCPSCGGEIIGDSVTAATKCPFCDNFAIMDAQVEGMLQPDFVIPFQKTKNQAIEALKNFYKGKKLLPKEFADENKINEIRGIYVPFWLFDCDADGFAVYDATRTHSWTSGDYHYTKTEHYRVTRSGSMGFDAIPADGSSKMPDEFMDSIEPFDLSAAQPFDTAFLSGYFADKFDVDVKESVPRINLRVSNTMLSTLRGTVHGYGTVSLRDSNVQTKNGRVHYALMPVWLLNTRYKDVVYTFAMNGQTGKLVGNLPVDKKKFWLRLAAAFGICLVGFTVLALLFGGLYYG